MNAMRCSTGLVLLALTLPAAAARAQPSTAAPDDRAISLGRWDVVSVEINGKLVDPELVAMLQVDYRADGSWAVLFKTLAVAEGTSTNHQDGSPKTFEMATLGSEQIKPSRYSGIYKLEGSTRLLCFVPDDKPRPDSFTAPKRSGRTLVTLRRARQP